MSAIARNIAGILVGVVLWMCGFFVLAVLVALVWPDYASHGRDWIRDSAFTFTAAMAFCNLLLWFAAAVFAGWTAAKIAPRAWALWTLVVLVTGYLALMHFVLYWDRFPWWYNLGAVIPSLPAILLGGGIAGRTFGGIPRAGSTTR